jgi:hypothetical protein
MRPNIRKYATSSDVVFDDTEVLSMTDCDEVTDVSGVVVTFST